MIDYNNPANKKKGKKSTVDFSNTEIAFSHKNDKQLKKAAWLFSLMNKKWFVDLTSPIGLMAVKLRLPFVNSIVKSTIFEQFVGGTTLLESQKSIDMLFDNQVQSILDYGAEAKKRKKISIIP